MPDHLHLIMTGTDDEVDLLKAIGGFKQKTGFWLSKNKRDVQWQKDFFDHIIRKEEGLVNVAKYILNNPVRKGLVENWQDYPFKGAFGCNLEDILESMI